jgi:hypothetical protein
MVTKGGCIQIAQFEWNPYGEGILALRTYLASRANVSLGWEVLYQQGHLGQDSTNG